MIPFRWFIFFTLFLSVSHSVCVWAEKIEPTCFDFQAKNFPDLVPTPDLLKLETDQEAFGHLEKYDWANTGGIVKKSLLLIYQQILNPKTIRNDEHTTVQAQDQKSENFLKLQAIHIHTRPVFFLTLDWDENWGFQLLEGSESTPIAMRIAYQKTKGTSYIELLCGNIFLKALPETSENKDPRTAVFFYERMHASHRNAKDILNNIQGTLRTLRETGAPK